MSALHNIDKEGRASVVHTDLATSQFVVVDDGRVKLNDFNRGQFLRWNPETQEICPFTYSLNGGIDRSPEEYGYLPETEKVSLTGIPLHGISGFFCY